MKKMNLENIQVTIKKYLDGTMTVQEKVDFETEIKNSKELAEEINQVRLLRIFNKNRDLIEAKSILKSVMADIHIEPDYGSYEKHFKKSIFGKYGLRWLLLSSLAIVFLIGGTVLYQKNQEAKALRDLSKAHLQPMENIIGFSPNDPSREAKAMQAYDNKNYNEAIIQLNSILKNDFNDNSLRLYLAVSYLMQDQNAEAEIHLQNIVKTNDIVTVPAKWYLALSLLQRGQKVEAKSLFQSLSEDTTFGTEAKEILKQL